MRKISISNLIGHFTQGLSVLVPIAEDLDIFWKSPNNYDDWDAVAAGLYEGFVLCAIRSSLEGQNQRRKLVPFDHILPNYSLSGFVGIKLNNAALPFIRLDSIDEPFDTGVFASLNEVGEVIGTVRIPSTECKYYFFSDGYSALEAVDILTWD